MGGGFRDIGGKVRKRKRGGDMFLIDDFSKSVLLTVTSNALSW